MTAASGTRPPSRRYEARVDDSGRMHGYVYDSIVRSFSAGNGNKGVSITFRQPTSGEDFRPLLCIESPTLDPPVYTPVTVRLG